MHLYDTAARAVRPFQPAGETVTLYVCGITPYDAAHLGHAFTYHVFDVVTRRLLAAGHPVRSVRNITDCDDDLFRVARERNLDHRALVADQVARFDEEMTALGILPVDSAPRASHHVADMIDWITRLEGEGFTYASDGWVYFDVERFPAYGRLSGLDAGTMLALSRTRGGDPDDPRKRHPLDFVLWQPSLPDELAWPSPWSRGRPGWHIECSVLATKHLGHPVDLHGGGDDLVFPHHECEIAQAEAGGAQPFVRHWMHVAMVRLGGEKMSKSLGNLVFVPDLLAAASPQAVRLLLSAHHWRESWDYVPEELAEAEARAARYLAACGHRLDPAHAVHAERSVLDRLDDDLDTPGALRILDEVATAALGEAEAGAGEPSAATALGRVAGLLGAELSAVGQRRLLGI